MASKADRRAWLGDVQQRLEPRTARARIAAELDEVFRSGSIPDPQPEGFLPGRLLTMTWWGPSDALVGRIAGWYMPWLGKSFDPAASEGINVLRKNARLPMRALWPGYVPPRELADRLEAFPFRTRIDPGAIDPDVKVLKIDYNFEANPNLVIRHILDELVQIDDGVFLGKILYRTKRGHHPIGFFSLENADLP